MKDLDFLGTKNLKISPSRGISEDLCVPQSTYTSFYIILVCFYKSLLREGGEGGGYIVYKNPPIRGEYW